jgi:hypothetical protein
MIDKASPAGWVVQVTMATAPASQEGARWIGPQMPGAPSFRYYNVAIGSPDKAIEAAANYVAKGKADAADVATSTVRQLSSAEVAALGLKPGEAKPA